MSQKYELNCFYTLRASEKNSEEMKELGHNNNTEFQLSKREEPMCLLFYYIHDLIHNNVSKFSYSHQYLNEKCRLIPTLGPSNN